MEISDPAEKKQDATVETPQSDHKGPTAFHRSSKNPLVNLFGKNRKYAIFALVAILLLALLGGYFFFTGPNSPDNPQTASQPEETPKPDAVIAKVGDSNVYQSYITKELKLYPATKSAEVKEKLKQKVIDDQITLVEAKEAGWIQDFNQNVTLTDQEYISRTKSVLEVKKKIEGERDSLSGSLISVGFYYGAGNANQLKTNQDLAFSKVNPVYEKVKNKQLTVQQAKETLFADRDLKRLDPALETNVSVTFQIKKGNMITYWGDFDKMLWEAPEGGVTPLYIGKAQDNQGDITQATYVFGVIDNKTENAGFVNYQQWLQQKRQEYKLSQTGFSIRDLVLSFLGIEVLAQDSCCDSVSNNDNGGNAGDGNLSNQNHTQDNPPNTCDHVPNSAGGDCGGGGGPAASPPPPLAPAWAGNVTTPTGAPLPGASINIQCSTGSAVTSTNGSGAYFTGPHYNITHVCNPITLTASFGGQNCEVRQVNIPNTTNTQYNDFVCDLGPPACGKACPSDAYCEGAEDGCTVCRPNDAGTGNVCRPAPACNISCSRDDQCAGARDGCSVCLTNDSGTGKSCRQAPACNVSCTRDDQCAGARDGCSVCLLNDEGTGRVCRQAPACNVSCVRDDQCAGSRDGCNSCLPSDSGSGKVCRETPACGVSCTRDDQCTGARDGCSACVPNNEGTGNVCSKPPACNSTCVRDDQCAGAKDGCTSCLPGDSGSGNVCRPAPACGVACTKNSQCAGARDGCGQCLEGTCTDFNENMCKCDGFNAIELHQPPRGNYVFEAFGKIEGNDLSKAKIDSITFRIYKSSKSNPNEATVIAQSNAIVPTLVENTSSKARYRAEWSVAPPTADTNALYRARADIKCSPKKIVSNRTASLNSSNVLGQNLYSPVALAQAPLPTPDDNLQVKTINFARIVEADNCKQLVWEYFNK